MPVFVSFGKATTSGKPVERPNIKKIIYTNRPENAVSFLISDFGIRHNHKLWDSIMVCGFANNECKNVRLLCLMHKY